MGYYINLVEGSFEIERDKKAGALAAAKKLFDEVQTRGSGGTFIHGQEPIHHFAGVDTKRALETTSIEEMLHEWGFYTSTDTEGNLTNLDWAYEKAGDEEQLLEAIAPFVKKGSFLRWRGEDGDMWSYKFSGKKMTIKAAKVVW